jgi:DNA-binding CsgD family transcriptional regulator
VSVAITETLVLRLVDQIYDAALEPTRWPKFLAAFARAVNGQGTLIYTHNVETAEASTTPDPTALNAAVNFDSAFLKSLGDYYNRVNVWAQNEAVLKPGRLVTGSMLYPVKELLKTEFYNDWLRPQDFLHAVGGIIVQDGPWAAKFSCLRSHRAGDYTPDELRLYRELLPHLARAAHIQRRFAFLQRLSTSSLAVLDTVPAAIMLLDASGRVVHVNASADAELRRGDPLRLNRSGELTGRGSAQLQAALRTAIIAALNPFRGTREQLSNVASLSRRNGEVLSVQALPLPQHREIAGVTTIALRLAACALVVYGSGSPVPAVGPQLLRHVYGLTPAEVQVVLALSEGETINRYVERRGISRNTAVTQLKRAFDKTGMRRQSDLVRWLFQCGAARAPDRVN